MPHPPERTELQWTPQPPRWLPAHGKNQENLIFFASKRSRAVPIADEDGHFYAPTDANVRSLRYPLTRFVTVCVNKPPDKPLAPAIAEFLRFLLSAEGQQVVAAGGNVRLDAPTAWQGRRAVE